MSLFAPDEASHPGYAQVLERIHQRGLITSFGSMRLDVVVKKDLPFKPNMLIRVGLDGLTEATRYRVGRRISDDLVYDYFSYMARRGHRNFKIFMVFSYPWETEADFDQWEALWDRISRIPVTANCHVRAKFTPLIPQLGTPLGIHEPSYSPDLAGRIIEWFKARGKPYRNPGWYLQNDGLMSQRTHTQQCALARGDESLLLNRSFPDAGKARGYEIWRRRHGAGGVGGRVLRRRES